MVIRDTFTPKSNNFEIYLPDEFIGKKVEVVIRIVESDKHGGGHFLTNDKRLLRKNTGLSHLLQIEIVTPTEFLNVLKNFEAQDR